MNKNQLIVVACVILGIIVVVSIIKGIIKLAITVGLIAICILAFGHFTGSSVKDLSKLASTGVSSVQQIKDLAQGSNNIKVDASDGLDVKFKVADTWIDTKDIKKVVSINGNKATIVVGDKNYDIDSQEVIKLLQIIKN